MAVGENPFVHESFTARHYEMTIADIATYGHEAIFQLTNSAQWIERHRLPRMGVLDIEATAQSLGVPLLFDKEKCDLAHGVTSGLPWSPQENLPLSIILNPESDEDEYPITFGHEVGHVFLALALNLRHDTYSPEVEKFCELFGVHFVLPPHELPSVGSAVDEALLLRYHEERGIKMSQVIHQFVRKGLLPERLYVDSIIGWGERTGEMVRDVVCLPCRKEYGSCAGQPSPTTLLTFPENAFGGCFPVCANDRGDL